MAEKLTYAHKSVLDEAISSGWWFDTACDSKKWNPLKPEAEQCLVTAYTLGVVLGWDVIISEVGKVNLNLLPPDETHFWNHTGYEEYDRTRSQFSDRIIIPKGNIIPISTLSEWDVVVATAPILINWVNSYLKSHKYYRPFKKVVNPNGLLNQR